MKKIIISLFALSALASCTYKYTPVSSSMIDVTNYNIGNINSLKTGEACITRVFGFSSPNASTSVIDAMRDGGISTIKMVDKKSTISLFYSKYCTIVHGI